ncbi:MAG: hypothetical protein RIF32_18565 [Leptospirales bacterium]
MYERNPQFQPIAPGRSMRFRRRRIGRLAAACAVCLKVGLVLTATLSFANTPDLEAPPEPRTLKLRFPLQEVDVDPDRRQELRAFLAEHSLRSPYFLIQGFACDTGGYDISIRVARRRGSSVAAEITASAGTALRSAGERLVRQADPAVLHGSGREEFRRAEIRVFRNAVLRDRALVAANRAAAGWNQAARLAPDARGAAVENSTNSAGTGSSRKQLYFLFGLLLLLLAVGLIWLYSGRRNPTERHRLTAEEAEALELLTGGEVAPIPAGGAGSEFQTGAAAPKHSNHKSKPGAGAVPAENASGAAPEGLRAASGPTPEDRSRAATGRMANFIDRARKQTMGVKKKSKTKITPISIRGAVDRDFEEKSLGELSRAPIHALEGLTPRHARMMEEAFGVKTVEDLARLKYVEIARAIVVLSRYEK